MRIFFVAYQFITPFLFLPATYWLWYHSSGNSTFAWYVVTIPVIFGYVMPGLFTNVFKLWEFNTGFKIGAFRPHNGFVFGAFNSLASWLALGGMYQSGLGSAGITIWEILRSGFVVGTVIGFWGWYYDTHAVKSKFISLYNRAAFENRSPEENVFEYAPLTFGAFGFAYGMAVRVGELLLFQQGRTELYWPLVAGMVAFCFIIPAVLYISVHYLAHGETGLRSFKKEIKEREARAQAGSS